MTSSMMAPMATLLLLPLLMLLPTALAQKPPEFNLVDDMMQRVNLTAQSKAVIKCPDRDGAFVGISDRNNSEYVSRTQDFEVDLAHRQGDLDDLRRVRNLRLGAYHCLYRREADKVDAYAIVLSELPEGEIASERVLPNIRDKWVRMTCDLSRLGADSSDTRTQFIWEFYNQSTGLFQEHIRTQNFKVTYTELERQNHLVTVYRCFTVDKPETMHYKQIKPDKKSFIYDMTYSNYSSTVIPVVVKYNESIALNCYGRDKLFAEGAPRDVMYHKRNGIFVKVNYSDPRYADDKKFNQRLAFTVNNVDEEYDGVYVCKKDNATEISRIKLYYGSVEVVPVGDHLMKKKNSAVCKPEITKMAPKYLAIQIERPGKKTLVLRGNQTTEGFTVYMDSDNHLCVDFDDTIDSKSVAITCQLKEETAFVTFRKPNHTITLRKRVISARTFELICEKADSFLTSKDDEYKIYWVFKNGTRIPQRDFEHNSETVRTYLQDVKYGEFVCRAFVLPDGPLLESNLVTHDVRPVNLGIGIGVASRSGRPQMMVAGRDVPIFCNFRGLEASGRRPSAAAVSLWKDGVRLPLAPTGEGNFTFRFLLRSAGPEQSGEYKCMYNSSGDGGGRSVGGGAGGVALTGVFESPPAQLTVCTSDKFICDQKCMNKSILCDGKADCVDGMDESPENCNECEPNEVPCGVYNGTKPEKKCVLKHWLCDNANDCGNGYDEDKVLHAKWCAVPSCTCPLGYACCPGTTGVCIRREYECDREPDCTHGSDEPAVCRSPDCIEIVEPKERQTIRLRVGQPLNLTCVATGNERPTINWRRNWGAVPLNTSEELTGVSRDRSGLYTMRGNLLAERVAFNMAGVYNCEAVNNCGRKMSYEIELVVVDFAVE